MEDLLWIGTAVAGAFFIGLSVFNWRVFVKNILRGDTRMSPAPWIGGAAGAFALWLCPEEAAFTWWWIPFCIDFGSIPNTLWVAYSAATSKV